MGDLEDLDLGQVPRQERRVDLLLDVAGEEEAVTSDLAEEDDRDVVDPGSAVGRRLRDAPGVRPQDSELDVVDCQPVARGQDATLDPARRQRAVERLVARARPDHPGFEDPLHPVPVEEAGQPGGMVLVGMAEDDDVDPSVPRRQVLVEGDQQPTRIGAAVNEETGAALAFEEDRVALPDVEDGEAGDAVGTMDHRDREGDQCHGQASREALPEATSTPARPSSLVTPGRRCRWRRCGARPNRQHGPGGATPSA